MTLPQADKKVAGRYIPLISDEAKAGLAQIEHSQRAAHTWPPDAQVTVSRTEVVLERILRLATQARAGVPPSERAPGT